jgi:carbon starvation protein
MSAMPVLIAVLCIMAIAYRYYSAFLAAKVAVLDDSKPTPAITKADGQNFHATNRWVLFGHHFAAISGSGPLIGPVLAAQFGYLPGLLWIVIGVCLAGAVQDFLALSMSIRRGGKSLAQIATDEIGPIAGTAATIAILFILVIALAGLGKVVVQALGGQAVSYPAGSVLTLPAGTQAAPGGDERGDYQIPTGASLAWPGGTMVLPERFTLHTAQPLSQFTRGQSITLPADAKRVQTGSIWGVFTIGATIPIALFVGLYMYKIRPGKVVEASLIGGALILFATFAGGYVAHQPWGRIFDMSDDGVTLWMAVYGFVASVLPVWILLAPRDYLSSFLKIGTIALLVIGTILANPTFQAPAINRIFLGGGPIVTRSIFPFLFITIMCGAISGFHSLVSTGTTSKMISREGDARMIGYGAMLIEGLVAVVAIIAATTLPSADYYAMNTELSQVPRYHDQIRLISGEPDHLQIYEARTEESLRGRTGGAVTLAVGMAHIFDGAANRIWAGGAKSLEGMWKYWYHFAIMFEALFILTTIDAGTRIGRFLLQEIAGRVNPSLGRPGWWPGTIISAAIIVSAWTYFIYANSMNTIWPMFGIANQMLAVIALAVISVYLVNEGRLRYVAVTVLPMALVATTTTTASAELLSFYITSIHTHWHLHATQGWSFLIPPAVPVLLIGAMLICTALVVGAAAIRVYSALAGGGVEALQIATPAEGSF